MAAPITTLEVVQVGLEATRGTAVAATSVLDMDPFGATLKREPNIIRIRQAGSLATSHRSNPGKDVVAIDVSGTWTYNWAPWWFNLFLGPLASSTGASADKTWTFGSAVISDSSDNLKTATFEVGGKDTWPSEYQIKGVIGDKLTLSIKQNAAWTYKASMIGMLVTPQAKTGSISVLSSIYDVLGTTTKVYLDSASGFGTTQKTGDVLSADITIDVGTSGRFTLDGQRSAYRVAVTGPRKITGKVVAEYDSQTDYTAVHAATAQRLRLVSTGPTLGGSNYKCQLDIGGTWDGLVLGKDGDVITEELNLTGQYDSSIGADINAVVVNAATALP